ncbi:MAG TPA: site-specific integrase [Gaiellaceae bacterium]|nr:site-specific integrase [Gaiellaceae bacterium]
MPSGAAVIRYDGSRGVVWRIKWTDASGRQVQETIGAERDGVTKKQAEVELRERLTRVAKKGYRRPQRLTFCEYAETWMTEGQQRRAWKPKTVKAYRNALDRLLPTFGPLPLAVVRPRDIAAHVKDALGDHSPATVNLDLTVLHNVYAAAKREELVDANPVESAERPKITRRRWRILEPAEVGLVLRSFTDEQARTIFLTLALTGLRRFELQNLCWRDVDLIENVLRVQESKSEEGERTVALAPPLAEALWQQKRRTAFNGDDDYVFCHPERGSRIGHEWYADEFRAALKAAGITDYVRPFHDARHGALTNMAAAGAAPVALMATAGHRSMQTTNQYLHLAGVVFRDEAEALARRYNFVPDSADLTASESTEQPATKPNRG